MNKEKALKNQGLEFREDMTVTGGYPNIAVTTITAVTRPPCKGNPPAVFPAAVLVADTVLA